MLDTLMKVLLYVLFPVGAMIVGGIIATFRTPGRRLGSAFQHFAAGMVFAAVAIELLPDVVSKRAPLPTSYARVCFRAPFIYTLGDVSFSIGTSSCASIYYL